VTHPVTTSDSIVMILVAQCFLTSDACVIKMKSWVRVLILTEVISAVLAIKCYTCDMEQNVTCPGWDRALVDSGTDLGDREGMFLTSCVTILVGETERRVVQQSIMPGHTHCTDIFIESWELLLNAKWNQQVEIKCCNEDGCNNEKNTLLNSSQPPSSIPSLILIAIMHFVSINSE